ncbi:SAVED domain-containing protein [Ruegeria sp. HKCCA4633]|uniref:SAVED domain-containing protein n=1 Tax=Ruegeria sp. HKCCA4633 TaxID=2682983 RepID=UPI00148894B7|nr:SAVED domain-containing protein [Ruegeria sp. HKCCA4633]
MFFKDSDPTYWAVQPRVLRQEFDKLIRGRFEDGDIRHLSVFGLAPIPLLMELGRLISDISDTDVYEKHREPDQWAWPEDGEEVSFITQRGTEGPKRVALKLSITSQISDDRITGAVGTDVSIWEIKSTPQKHGVIRHKEDLSRFRTIVRSTLDEIKNVHGMDVELMVFPAMPVSCSVEFGRVWQPKAHPDIHIYDQTKDQGFLQRMTLAGGAT